MDPFDKAQSEAVWQRVRGGMQPPGFWELALEEERIGALSQQLQRRGGSQKLLERCRREARARAAELRTMGRLAGEPGRSAPLGALTPSLPELIRRLADRSRFYDPEHPVYGPVFGQFRRECTDILRLLLRQADGNSTAILPHLR